MSGREWKPGDVASVLFDGMQAAYRTELGWTFIDGSTSGENADGYGFRPLVVIDPHDTMAVERLHDLYVAAENKGLSGLSMQAALTEFANPRPPKPEEPTGLGAVVEDATGRRWVRIGADDDPRDEHLRTQLSPPWRSRGMSAKWWANLHAVRVLSEGVRDV